MRPPISKFLDRMDERGARLLRRRLGGRGWLVSWYRLDAPNATRGPWLARVSSPDRPPTQEATGATRVWAARRAIRALKARGWGRDAIAAMISAE